MPFLDKDCQLRIDDNYIAPLYKHCINAEYPTMAVIGVVFTSAITQMIDLQVRTFWLQVNLAAIENKSCIYRWNLLCNI